jgi:hypothetical protein
MQAMNFDGGDAVPGVVLGLESIGNRHSAHMDYD